MKIFINPGHDPQLDPGACGNGLREADVVLNIGKRVESYLRAVGYDVKLFQYDGLGEICFDANSWKADLFISKRYLNFFIGRHEKFTSCHLHSKSARQFVARAIARDVTDYFQKEKPLPDVLDSPKTSKGTVGSHFNASEFVCHCC